MADSNVDIASQALARLGEPAISSFEDDSDAAEKVNLLYEPTVLQIFGSYPWRFASKRAVLEEDAAGTPENEWQRAFLMPPLQTDRVGNPLEVFNSTSVSAPAVFDYEIEGKWVLTNYSTVVIKYVQRKPEALWPGYFTTLVVEALASVLALPVTEIASKEELHRNIAYGPPSMKGQGGLFGVAMSADTRGNPTPSLLDDSDPIGSARFGGVY